MRHPCLSPASARWWYRPCSLAGDRVPPEGCLGSSCPARPPGPLGMSSAVRCPGCRASSLPRGSQLPPLRERSFAGRMRAVQRREPRAPPAALPRCVCTVGSRPRSRGIGRPVELTRRRGTRGGRPERAREGGPAGSGSLPSAGLSPSTPRALPLLERGDVLNLARRAEERVCSRPR